MSANCKAHLLLPGNVPATPGGAAHSGKHGGLWVVQPRSQHGIPLALGALPSSEGRTFLASAEGCGFDGHVVLFEDSFKPDVSHGQPTDQFLCVDVGSEAFAELERMISLARFLKWVLFHVKVQISGFFGKIKRPGRAGLVPTWKPSVGGELGRGQPDGRECGFQLQPAGGVQT